MVHGIDHIPELVERAAANVAKHDRELLDSGRVRFHVGDGRKGLPALAPFDAIHVGAATRPADVLVLKAQLKVGGRLVVPEGMDSTALMQYDRVSEYDFVPKRLMSVRYVPLTDKHKQLGRW